jgi:hypothetical protein
VVWWYYTTNTTLNCGIGQHLEPPRQPRQIAKFAFMQKKLEIAKKYGIIG